MTWVWNKIHPKNYDDDKEGPQLQVRQCDPLAPLRDYATYKPTGAYMEFCHNKENTIILLPGQPAGDDDKHDLDDQPKKHKKLRKVAEIGSSALVAEIVDDGILDPIYEYHKGWKVGLGPLAGMTAYLLQTKLHF